MAELEINWEKWGVLRRQSAVTSIRKGKLYLLNKWDRVSGDKWYGEDWGASLFFSLSNYSFPLSWVPKSKGMEWRISFFSLLVTLHWNEWASWAASTHCWLMSNFISTSIPRFFSKDLPLIPTSLNLCSSCGLPNQGAGPHIWPCWSSGGSTSQACHGLSGCHPFPEACQPHHSAWCHLKTCWGYTQSKVFVIHPDMEQYQQSQHGNWKLSLSTTGALD